MLIIFINPRKQWACSNSRTYRLKDDKNVVVGGGDTREFLLDDN